MSLWLSVKRKSFTDLQNQDTKTENVKSSLHNFISQVPTRLNEDWYYLKDCFVAPSTLGARIRALANRVEDFQDYNYETLVEGFMSEEYPQLVFFLSKIMNRLSDEQLNRFVKELFIAHGIEHSPVLIKKLKGLFSLQKIEAMIRSEFPQFVTTQSLIGDMQLLSEAEREALKINYQRSLERTVQIYLHQSIDFVLNLLVYLTHLKQFLPGQSNNVTDPYLRDIQYHTLMNNIAVFSGWLLALSVFTGNTALATLILGGGIASIIGIVSIYNKYFKPLPDELQLSRNLTKEAQNGSLPLVYGRDTEINELIDMLCANNETTRKHPILTGQTRVGKTEIVSGLVQRINAGLVPDELKDKKVFLFNTASLGFPGTIDDILSKIRGHESDYIFFFDEFHAVFGKSKALVDRFKNLIDPGQSNLKYCIFATTKNEFDQIVSSDAALLARLSEKTIYPLGDKEILMVLQEMVIKEAPDLVVPFDAIVTVAKLHLEREEYQGCSQPFTSKVILSQILAQVRNFKCTETEEKLKELNSKKLALQSRGTSFETSDFLFSDQGMIRTQEIVDINMQIKALNKQIKKAKAEVKQFQDNVRKYSVLRKTIKQTAYRLSENSPESTLQDFILTYYYLQNAFNQVILESVRKHPERIVSRERVLCHIDQEIEKKKEK